MRYYEGQFGVMFAINKCRDCEHLYTWSLTDDNGKKTGGKVYSCALYEPNVLSKKEQKQFPESIKNIDKIAPFCKLSKNKDKYTSREDYSIQVNHFR